MNKTLEQIRLAIPCCPSSNRQGNQRVSQYSMLSSCNLPRSGLVQLVIRWFWEPRNRQTSFPQTTHQAVCGTIKTSDGTWDLKEGCQRRRVVCGSDNHSSFRLQNIGRIATTKGPSVAHVGRAGHPAGLRSSC